MRGPESALVAHASLVSTLHPHPPRSPRRRRSRQPQAPAPRRLHPPARRRHLQLPPPRQPLPQQDHRHRPRRDGQDRPGVPPPRPQPARDLGGVRPLGRHGREHVPPQGPQRRRALPRHDPRRGHDLHRPQRAAQLQAAPADLVPDPDQVPRRAPPQVRPAARPPVHHEGRLLLRHRRRRPRRSATTSTTQAYRRIFTRCGLEFVAVEADSGAMGGSALAGVHGLHRRRRRPHRQLLPPATPPTSKRPPAQLAAVEDLAPTGDGMPELVHTPGQATIDEVGAFLNIAAPAADQDAWPTWSNSPARTTPSSASSAPVVVFLRGDHQLNEAKLARHRRGELRP